MAEVSPISDEEAEEMAQRFVTDEEDLQAISSKSGWADFVSEKIFSERHYDASDAQLNVLERGRMTGFQRWEDIGVIVTYEHPGFPKWQTLKDINTTQYLSRVEFDVRLTSLRLFGEVYTLLP